jgi:alcohol dehydrogenase class IV
VTQGFTWIDAERLVRFGPGVSEEAPGLLEERGFDGYVLLTTGRITEEDPAQDAVAALAEQLGASAEAVLQVPPGLVDEISAELMDEASGRPLVALGGGRVIDTAKAIAGASDNGRCAAIPTTLSGAPMTQYHRKPAGAKDARLARPELVVAEPALMTAQPHTQLAASAMNALAHAMESLYTPRANPVAELAALRAARLIAAGLPSEEPDTDALALAAVLAGYAVGSTGVAVHHAVCQTIVRVAGTPHAETNAVMLPQFARLMAPRAPAQMGALAEALGDQVHSAGAAGALTAKLAARSGHTRLSTLGVEDKQLPKVVEGVQGHPGLEATPDPPGPDDLLRLLQTAL